MCLSLLCGCLEEIVRVGRLLQEFLILRGKKNPRIAVAGLNPHAGEQGDMGSEEIHTISPAVARLNQIGQFVGPMPPEVARLIENGRLEIDFSFTIVSH